MSTERWFTDLLDSLKDDFDFRLETIILNLTEQISKKMEEKNINRSKLAELLKVSPPAVTKILNGTSNFTLKTLLSLADALELDLEIDFKERDVKTFPLADAWQYGVTSGVTADVTFGSAQEIITFRTLTMTTREGGVIQPAETVVTSGDLGFGQNTEMTTDSRLRPSQKEMDEQAA